jgi:hypothetical protein
MCGGAIGYTRHHRRFSDSGEAAGRSQAASGSVATGTPVLVTLSAVDRSAIAWLKWHFGLFSALHTYRGIHLPIRTVARVEGASATFADIPTVGSSFGLVGVALFRMVCLTVGDESEAGLISSNSFGLEEHSSHLAVRGYPA